MPIYEYVCQNSHCGKKFEKIVPSTKKDNEIPCSGCGQYTAKKQFSVFSFGSRSKLGNFTSSPSASGGGCGSCSSHNCSTCRH